MVEIYCIDNDIILKLATISLFDETLKTFNVDYSQVKILFEAIYQFKKLENKKKNQFNINKNRRYNENKIYSNLSEAINIVKKLKHNTLSVDDVDIDTINKLLDFDGIDAGEARLITYLCNKNKQKNITYLLTGDKRCLKALSNPKLTEIVKPLEKKFWCFEQLILRNIDEYGFDFIKEKVLPFKDCDGALKSVFGSGEYATIKTVQDSLILYIDNLKKETGNLLYPYP